MKALIILITFIVFSLGMIAGMLLYRAGMNFGRGTGDRDMDQYWKPGDDDDN